MKKLIVVATLLAAVSASALQAAPVSREKALSIAAKVFAGGPVTKAAGGNLSIIWEGEEPATKAPLEVNPPFYVINRDGGGFVIVAGFDHLRPVLGFSFDNSFEKDNMPANVKWLMDQIKAYCLSTGIPTREIVQLWAELEDTKAPLNDAFITGEFKNNHTVNWNQNGPANALTPVYGGQHSVCGCLPLAMAEILVWNGYPERGTGYLPSYQNNGSTVGGYDLDTEYMWEELRELDTYSEFLNCTDPVRTNLAQFVLDCGVMLQASYSPSGTGAYSEDVVKAYGTYMGYNKAANLEEMSNYSRSVWDAMLLDEVTQRPLLYCGFDPNPYTGGGHAYVLDGYATFMDSELVFHYNLGWGGSGNGYYYSSYQDTFTEGLQALFNFTPDPEGTSEYSLSLAVENYDSSNLGGLTVTDGPLSPGSSFSASLSYYYIMGSDNFDGYVFLVLEDKNGNEKCRFTLADYTGSPMDHRYYAGSSGSFTVPSDVELELGDQLVAYYSPDGTSLCTFRHPHDGSVPTEYPAFPVTFIHKNAHYSVGDYFTFQLDNCPYRYQDATWEITSPSGSVSTYAESDQEVRLTSSGRYKVVARTSQDTVITYINVN